MKRIIRDRRLNADEAAKYREIREQVAQELPDLIARHHQRMAALERIGELLKQLRSARERRGLSLTEISERSGVDESALSNLENGEMSDPTVETLVRYADAIGMRLELFLVEAAP